MANSRKSYRVRDDSDAAIINGYRNAIFLPGIGRYKGTWKANLREGLGTLTTKSGVIYDGNWMEDRKHGYGLLKKPLNTRRVQFKPIYDGEWKFNRRHGDGVAYYENGFYEGQWKNSCRNGLGIMSFDDGSYYMGEWKNDFYDGIGAHQNVNANTFYRGYFRNGKRCGEGELHFLRTRRMQKGVWVDGICVTSILQDDAQNESRNSLEEGIPKIGLANPVNVLNASLQSKNKDQKLTKFSEKQTVNFDCV